MKKMICIVCPRGCELQVEAIGGTCTVTGNFCSRGKDFVEGEMLHPTRTVQSTVRTAYKELPMVPVRTDGEVPKEVIPEVVRATGEVIIKNIMKIGDIIIKNVCNTGVNLILTSDMNLYIK